MAPAAAVATRATLESLLRERKLDTTLTTSRPWSDDRAAERLAPVSLVPLDTALGGGLPRGQVSEIVGPASSGRTSLVRSVMAAATRRGELVALVDTLDTFDPESAASAGVLLDQVLWIRGRDLPAGQPALSPEWEPARPRAGRTATPVSRALDRAIKAVGLVLSAGGFGVVVLDVADVPARALGQLPFTTWLRLQRMIEGTDTACVLLAAQPLARSAGGASVRLARGPRAARHAPRVPRPVSFHDLVRASRRPFIGPGMVARGSSERPAAGAVWSDGTSRPRRLRGLALHADVQCGLRSTSCALTLAR